MGGASELMLSGKTVTAEEAKELRLVDKVVAPEDLLSEASAVAKSMGENPQSALAMVKGLIFENMAETDISHGSEKRTRCPDEVLRVCGT